MNLKSAFSPGRETFFVLQFDRRQNLVLKTDGNGHPAEASLREGFLRNITGLTPIIIDFAQVGKDNMLQIIVRDGPEEICSLLV